MSVPVPAPGWRARPLLIALTLAAFALRAATLGTQSLWRDEVDAIHFALRPLGETVAMFTAMAQNGPLYFLTLRPWLQTVGSSEFALRLPSAFAGAISVPLLWQVARTLMGGRGVGAPMLAALLLGLNPYALWYSQEGKMYAIVTLLALAATWCWLRAVERGGWLRWVAYAVCVSLALYYHLLAVLLIPLHLIWCAIAWPLARRRWRGYLGALAALTLPYLPMLAWQWRMLLAPEKVTGFQYTSLRDVVTTTLLNQARGFAPGDALWPFMAVFLTGGLGLLLGWNELRADTAPLVLSGMRRFLLIVTWLVAPMLLIWLVSVRQPVFTDRYILWTLPASLMLVALGVQVVHSSMGRLAPAAALALAGTIAAVWLHAGWQQSTQTIKYDLRGAVRFVAERRQPETLLLLQIPHLEYAYRYYSGDQGTRPFAQSDARLGRWLGGLWTNYPAPDAEITAEVDRQMAGLLAGVAELWYIRSEPEMWDQRRLVDQWLAEHGTVTEQAEFHGAQVARIRLTP